MYKNKLLGFTLAVLLAIGIYRGEGEIFANENPITIVSDDGTSVGYTTLGDASDALKDGDTIVLNDNLNVTISDTSAKERKLLYIDDKDITLDGKGHTVTVVSDDTFSMIEVRPEGELTIKDVTLDSGYFDNRIYSNIINIEGGYVTMEEGTYLIGGRTNPVGIGTNEPGGTFVMNGGEISGAKVTTGGSDTGAAVTILEDSLFIMNGGKIHDNYSSRGPSGVMANRGGKAILNKGEIYNNTCEASMGSAVHIQGGEVDIHDGVRIYDNDSKGYGAIYVNNHQSFGDKWDGVLNLDGGEVKNNGNIAIFVWGNSIEGKGAYVRFSGSPDVSGSVYLIANDYTYLNYKPLEVVDEFSPKQPIVVASAYSYQVGQTIVQYTKPQLADSEQFIAANKNYGYQEDTTNNLLYTEQRRQIVFMDGEKELSSLTHYEFVDDHISDPAYTKPGYRLIGWYQDSDFNVKWDFNKDVVGRDDWPDTLVLYAKFEPLSAFLDLGEDQYHSLTCDQNEHVLKADFVEDKNHQYTYEWLDENSKVVGNDEHLTISDIANGTSTFYTLNVTATRTDNGQSVSDSRKHYVVKEEHSYGIQWNYNDKEHYHECSICHKWNDVAEHTFGDWNVTKDATATEKGVKEHICSVCGYKETAEVPAIGVPEEPSTPESPDNSGDINVPQTGDSSNIALWIAFMFVSSTLLVIAGVYKKKKRVR